MSIALRNRSGHGFIDVTDPVRMDVDLEALRSNFRAVRALVGDGVGIMASIKGNGYGVGAVPVAAALRDMNVFAVATGGIRDAIAIRQAGNDVPIHMFPGILPGALGVLFANDLMPSIYTAELADAASDVATSPWKVFVKVDAGYGRLGVPIDEAEGFVLDVARKRNLQVEGLFTHLPFSGAEVPPWVSDKLQRFDELGERLRRKGLEIPIRQSLASIGVIKGLRTASNAVCVGHLLFGGLGRFAAGDPLASRFAPVHETIRTRLVDVRRYERDSTAGASGNVRIKAGCVLGTVPIGLHEGYRAGASGHSPHMLIDGVQAPVLWVSQEYAVLDLTERSSAVVGDEVIALGRSGDARITIEELSAWQGRSPLELAMSMDLAMPKHYLRQQQKH